MPIPPESRRPLPLPHGIAIGAQYYRAPTPRPEDWERDLDAMRDAGMDCAKLWVQWRWSRPSEGEFYWEDGDRLMDLCAERGLNAVLNVIFDVMPAWLPLAHPDCLMVRCDGRLVQPTALPHRQIGGAPGPCLNHPAALAERRRFLEATVARYAGHPAMWLWDLWNEPELTCGLVRGGPAADQVCWCASCRARFLPWLEGRYASLDALNEAWARNYTRWEEIELPREYVVGADWQDWRLFQRDTVAGEMRWRAEVTRTLDPVHPLMCHTVPAPIFNVSSCGADDFALAEECDVFGCTSSCTLPVMVDWARSAGRGRTMIASEIHALPGATLHRPNPLSRSDLARQILHPLFEGVRGFLFWQYRAELLGREGPAWGMTKPDGTPEPWLGHLSDLTATLRGHADFLRVAEPTPAQVAILESPENEIFFQTHDGSLDRYWAGMLGAHELLRDLGYRVDFVDEAGLAESAHRALVLPVPYALPTSTAAAVAEWVGRGGRLISEGFPCALDPTTATTATTNPGAGLDALFGCRESRVLPSARVDVGASYGVGRDERLAEPAFTLTDGPRIVGRFAEQHLEPTTAEVLGRFADGSAAVTRSAFGDGTAVLIGCWVFSAWRETRDPAIPACIASLLGPVRPTLEWRGEGRVALLTSAGRGAWLMLDNAASEPREVTVTWPGEPKRLTAVYGEARVAWSGGALCCVLPSDSVAVVALQ